MRCLLEKWNVDRKVEARSWGQELVEVDQELVQVLKHLLGRSPITMDLLLLLGLHFQPIDRLVIPRLSTAKSDARPDLNIKSPDCLEYASLRSKPTPWKSFHIFRDSMREANGHRRMAEHMIFIFASKLLADHGTLGDDGAKEESAPLLLERCGHHVSESMGFKNTVRCSGNMVHQLVVNI